MWESEIMSVENVRKMRKLYLNDTQKPWWPVSTHLVPRQILPTSHTCPAHFMDPLVQMRALLQGKTPPNILEGTIAWYLLPIGNELGNILGVDVVPLVIGDGIHSVRAQFFTFQILTFDKTRFPCALIIAWKSHHSPYPHCTSTPSQLTHQDEHGQE